MWATNLKADLACSRKSAEVFSRQQANRTDGIDQAARAKFSLLGQRCTISLLTTRSLGSKKLSSKQRQSRAGRRLSCQGPTKGRDFSPRPKSERAQRPQLGSDHGCQKPVHQSAQSALCMPSRSTLMRLWLLSSATRVNTDLLSPLLQQASIRRT